ncbi:hypothetical protein J2W17_002060 [Pseudomonas lini]|uniref:hypothetical protein n=1 Tax=Pseudomonas lini TaxID=163011 RepID=UPI0027808385|nr:hypothetical protein [Pseudomonas lini]MDQ0123113.1 hypothetical protein [Pseudomonas lini]
MKIIFLFVLAVFAAGVGEASEFNYKRVLMAGTGDVGNLLVRYLISSDESCIFIQNLLPGGKGTVSAEKKICSLAGKSFDDGYTAVDVKEGAFKDGKLLFKIGVTPLQPIGESIMSCEVIFYNGLADHLSCQEKVEINEVTCK